MFNDMVAEWISNNVGWVVIIVLFLISALFEIVKIPIHPITGPYKWIKKKMTTPSVRKMIIDLGAKVDDYKNDTNKQISDLRSDIDSFEKNTNESIAQIKSGTSETCEVLKGRLNDMEKSNDLQTIRQIRTHVLDFANSCRNGRKHTQEEFRSLFDENSEYEHIVNKYDDIVNDYYVEGLKFIKRVYQNCLDNNDFLA